MLLRRIYKKCPPLLEIHVLRSFLFSFCSRFSRVAFYPVSFYLIFPGGHFQFSASRYFFYLLLLYVHRYVHGEIITNKRTKHFLDFFSTDLGLQLFKISYFFSSEAIFILFKAKWRDIDLCFPQGSSLLSRFFQSALCRIF